VPVVAQAEISAPLEWRLITSSGSWAPSEPKVAVAVGGAVALLRGADHDMVLTARCFWL
jgi:hypothetical protein